MVATTPIATATHIRPFIRASVPPVGELGLVILFLFRKDTPVTEPRLRVSM